ncbi:MULTISPECIES: chlorophyll a/b-binding protein [Prochlorococcus]|uniref:chlorophyll a/b-binding protein n=1 Tax=Prochlorococcus TaxID=1218 RepID=UPI00068CE3FD|nr:MULTISPECIES: chlorophyll a/b-binding protein [Prochlorococcus]
MTKPSKEQEEQIIKQTIQKNNETALESRENARWLDNSGQSVDQVFGFNENAELVNGRAAMFGFLMLIVTEIVFGGQAATHSIFGLG